MTPQQIANLLQQVLDAYNAILTNAKTIEQFEEETTLLIDSFLLTSNSGVTKKLKIRKIIEGIVQTYIDRLIYVGELVIDGNDVTVPEGVQALINNITYFTTADFTFTIDFASSGNSRVDIIVMNTSADLVHIEGVETSGVAVRPNIPPATVLVTQINVTEDTLSSFTPLILPENILSALNGANSPSEDNVFVTMEDLEEVSGKTPVNIRDVYNGSSVTVPTGFVATRVIDLNDFNTDVTAGTVTGTSMPITGGVNGNVYLIDGYTS